MSERYANERPMWSRQRAKMREARMTRAIFVMRSMRSSRAGVELTDQPPAEATRPKMRSKGMHVPTSMTNQPRR